MEFGWTTVIPGEAAHQQDRDGGENHFSYGSFFKTLECLLILTELSNCFKTV